MGYVGNQQTEGFSQVPAKQDLTGAAGTSLTLTHAVANAEGIDLFINNVRQEPTTAYSVGADGVTVTLTGSVVATDDIYVIYNSLARQTSTHPSNQALQATSGTFSGAVSAASATVTGDLTVDTNTLYVDSTNNRVGIGTSSPAYKTEIVSSSDADLLQIKSTASANNTILRLGISGNDAVISGSGGSEGRLVFKTYGTERMRLDSSGRAMWGITSYATTPTTGITFNTDSNASVNIGHTSSPSGYLYVNFGYGGTQIGSIAQSGTTSVSYNTSSDYRLKTAVNYDWDATTRLKQLRPARFEWIADGDDAVPVDGFLAHEVQDIVPEAISGIHNEVDDEGNPVYQGIDQSKLVPLLVKTIQELEARIVALEAN